MPPADPLASNFRQPPLARRGSLPEGWSAAKARARLGAFGPNTPALYAALAGAAAAYLAVMLWAKQAFYRRRERRSGTAR